MSSFVSGAICTMSRSFLSLISFRRSAGKAIVRLCFFTSSESLYALDNALDFGWPNPCSSTVFSHCENNFPTNAEEVARWLRSKNFFCASISQEDESSAGESSVLACSVLFSVALDDVLDRVGARHTRSSFLARLFDLSRLCRIIGANTHRY